MKERIVEKGRGGFCRAAGFVFFVLLTLLPLSSQALPDKPTVEAGAIYGNGFELRISAAEGGTKIEYRKPGESGYQVLDLDPNTDKVQETADLSSWTIYGGAKTEAVQNTSILMTGGRVHTIYGGGKAEVTGNTSVTAVNKRDLNIEKISGGGDSALVGGETKGYIETEAELAKAVVDERSFDRLFYARKGRFRNSYGYELAGSVWTVKGQADFPSEHSYYKKDEKTVIENLELQLSENAEFTLGKAIEIKKLFLFYGLAKQAENLSKIELKTGCNAEYSKITAADLSIADMDYNGEEREPSIKLSKNEAQKEYKKVFKKDFEANIAVYEKVYENNTKAGVARVFLSREVAGEEILISKEFNIRPIAAYFEKIFDDHKIGVYDKDGRYSNEFVYGDKFIVKVKLKTDSEGKFNTDLSKGRLSLVVKEDKKEILTNESVFLGEEVVFEYDTRNKGLKIGENTLLVKYLGNGNISPCNEEIQLTLKKKPLNASTDAKWHGEDLDKFTKSSATKFYDGTAKFDKLRLILKGVEAGDKVEGNVEAEATDLSGNPMILPEAWPFRIIGEPNLEGEDCDFYSLSKDGISLEGRVWIRSRILKVNWSDTTVLYDGKEHIPKAELHPDEVLPQDRPNLSVKLSVEPKIEVGRYEVIAYLPQEFQKKYHIENPKCEFVIKENTLLQPDPPVQPPTPPADPPILIPDPPILIPDPYVPSPQPPQEPEKPEEPKEEPETIEWEPRENTPIDKVWAIRLSLPMDPETLEEGNVYIEALDEPGKAIEAKLELSEDKKSIHIRPAQTFAYGREYRLHIRNLKTEDGRKLKNNVSMIFRTLAQ